MSKEGGIGFAGLTAGAPWAVGLVAVAALLSRGPAPAPVSAPPTTDTASTTTAAEPPGRALAAVVPIVKLIADVANVRVTPPDVVQSWEVLRPHLENRAAERARETVGRVGRMVYGAPAASADDVPLLGEEEALAILSGLELPGRGDLEGHRKRVLDHFKNTRAPAAYVRRVRDEVKKVANVKFLIVTVPDYVDSYSRWTADEAFSAIQAAAGTAGYALDRFLTPGWPQARGADTRARRVQEFEPGALIFKGSPSRRPVDQPGPPVAVENATATEPLAQHLQLLVVLVVAETATRGLEKPAFAAASQLVMNWTPTGPVELKILGPHYSGTSQSLRLALEETFEEAGGRVASGDLRAQVVTGSATSTKNKELIEGFTVDEDGRIHESDFGTHTGGNVSFESAVHTDADMLKAVETRLDSMGIPRSQVALLIEENTAWGRALFNASDASGSGKSRCDSAEAGSFACAFRLPFPMHVSRLAAETGKGAMPLAGGPQGPSLDLTDATEPSDRLPTFTPRLTEGVLATVLTNILSTLSREQVRAVGILATDKRDFVFLAREVIRAVPNVQLFTTEPHILFLHPEYRSFVRGTLVASSYALDPRTQQSVTLPHATDASGPQQRRQFVTMAAQGRYNAFLYLLDRPELLVDAYPRLVTPDPLESPLKPAAVWLSIVGQNRFVPLEATARTRHPLLSIPYLSLNSAWAAVRILLILTLLAHLALVIAARFGRTPLLRSVFAPFTPASDPSVAGEQALLTSAVVTSISLLLVWLMMIGRAITTDRGVTSAIVTLPLFAAVSIVGAVAAAQLLVRGVRQAVEGWKVARSQPSSGGQQPLTVAISLVAVSALAGLTYASVIRFVLARPEFAHAWRVSVDGASIELADIQLAAERTLDVASFVSPTAPVLAFGVIGYLWAMWSLRCLRHQTYRMEATAPLMLTLARNDRRLAADLAGALATTVHPTGRYFVLPLAALLLVVPGLRSTFSVDGRAFADALVFGSVLALLAVTVEAAQAAWLGWRLKSILERLRLHPIAEEIIARGKDPLDWGISVEPKFGTARRVLRDRLMEVRQHLQRVPQAIVRPHVREAVYQGAERRLEPSTNVPPPVTAPLPDGIAAFGQRASLRGGDLGWIRALGPRRARPGRAHRHGHRRRTLRRGHESLVRDDALARRRNRLQPGGACPLAKLLVQRTPARLPHPGRRLFPLGRAFRLADGGTGPARRRRTRGARPEPRPVAGCRVVRGPPALHVPGPAVLVDDGPGGADNRRRHRRHAVDCPRTRRDPERPVVDATRPGRDRERARDADCGLRGAPAADHLRHAVPGGRGRPLDVARTRAASPAAVGRSAGARARSERLEVLQQALASLARQRRAVRVPAVAVAAQTRVEQHAFTLGLLAAGDEPDVLEVVDVVRAVERGGPLLGKQQRPQRGHRAVVEVGRAEPQAVERHVRVAVRLAEVIEPPRVPFADRVHLGGERRRERIEPLAIGADLAERCHLPDTRRTDVVARRARLVVHRAARVERAIDRCGPRETTAP